jgi:hypothetical protein
MDDERLRSLAKPGINSLWLLTLLVICLLHAPDGRALATFQTTATQPGATRAGGTRNHGGQESPKSLGPADLTATESQSAPPARTPYLRVATILLAGLVISAARLARKFRHFLGLGVFANGYSAVFLVLAAGISGLPATFAETTLISHLDPWAGGIAQISGVIIALLLPAVRRKTITSAQPVLGLDFASSNSVRAVIEDGIRDHILARMQVEMVSAAHRYSWGQIKLATRRVVEEEVTVGRLDRQAGEVAVKSVDEFQPSANPHTDFENKYTALIRLLRSCSFSRLRLSLAAAAVEGVQ